MTHVRVLATGGTIASFPDGLRAGDDLVRELGFDPVHTGFSIEQPMNVPSSCITVHDQVALARRIKAIADSEPHVDAAVIFHGTDTIEETAFTLHLLGKARFPTVLTGAMRPPHEPDSDATTNIRDAFTVAHLLRRGQHPPVVVMNGRVHTAATVRKCHARNIDAFDSDDPLRVATAHADPTVLDRLRQPPRIAFDIDATPETSVALVRLSAGDDGRLIRLAAEDGVKGLVVEVFGAGNVPDAPRDAMLAAMDRGVIVVLVSRTGAGAIEIPTALRASNVVCGHDLDGLKARLALMFSLATDTTPQHVQARFDQRLA